MDHFVPGGDDACVERWVFECKSGFLQFVLVDAHECPVGKRNDVKVEIVPNQEWCLSTDVQPGRVGDVGIPAAQVTCRAADGEHVEWKHGREGLQEQIAGPEGETMENDRHVSPPGLDLDPGFRLMDSNHPAGVASDFPALRIEFGKHDVSARYQLAPGSQRG